MVMDARSHTPSPAFVSTADVHVDELAALVRATTAPETCPHAAEIVSEAVIYDAASVTDAIGDPSTRRSILAEMARVLAEGSGVIVIRGAVASAALDAATEAFEAMIAEEQAAGMVAGDHYAEPGANERVWNALEKLAVDAPSVFVDYYANVAIDVASTAWLGPAYQVTSQINVVNPGGAAQAPHRDYHLGFMTDAQAEQYPAHAHALSPVLTLQGAIAHCDMPVDSGPTKLLPHSHRYLPGYLAWRRPEVVELFDAEHVQLELAAGDALFFNPAVLHAAGSNTTADVRRMANLLQVNSAFGRSLESIDRVRLVQAVYPELVRRADAGWPEDALARVLAASAEGYPFPTNLDRDPPVEGLAPPAQADIVAEALRERWPPDRLDGALAALAERQRSH